MELSAGWWLVGLRLDELGSASRSHPEAIRNLIRRYLPRVAFLMAIVSWCHTLGGAELCPKE